MNDDPYDGESPLRINAFIHTVVLSGDWKTWKVDWDRIWKYFGDFYRDPNFVPSDRMPNYEKKWIGHRQKYKIILFTNRTNKYCAPYLMEIHMRENSSMTDLKNLLGDISSFLPTWKVSRVDYTLDIFCYDQEAARRLFRHIKRNSYIPYKRRIKLYAEKGVEWGDETRMNIVYRISDVNFYERGPDNKKVKDHWLMKDIDRVRLEYSASRRTLSKHGITKIIDLIKNPKFYNINEGIYEFRCFRGSKKLPEVWEKYPTPDEDGNMGAFQLEVMGHPDKVKNIHQYITDIGEFDVLKSSLINEMKMFDSIWGV